MKMNKEEFINTLILKAKENNIIISNEQAEKMYTYKELLLEWNEKINLTAITEDDEIITKHFIDSLLCIDDLKDVKTLIDVGTGAGFPGIVLAIYIEGNINITLLDSLNKRIKFLDIVIEKLELSNVKTIHGRAEEIAHKEEHREKYDIAIARAVAPLNILLEYLTGYVKKDGKCICLKSISVQDEIKNANKALNVLNLKLERQEMKTIELNEDNLIRQILVFKKENNINNKYPRNYGKIKKSPL